MNPKRVLTNLSFSLWYTYKVPSKNSKIEQVTETIGFFQDTFLTSIMHGLGIFFTIKAARANDRAVKFIQKIKKYLRSYQLGNIIT